jgi:hypothetical protein
MINSNTATIVNEIVTCDCDCDCAYVERRLSTLALALAARRRRTETDERGERHSELCLVPSTALRSAILRSVHKHEHEQ